MGVISKPFGLLLFWLNNFLNNYGVALIFFTLIVRALLLPLSIKQQKSMAESQKIQPQLNLIRDKYKDDKQKLNEETMKLYKDSGVNPAGGCFPVLIQFPIIIGLYQAIIRPLTYMFRLSTEQIELVTAKVNEILTAQGAEVIKSVGQFEIAVAQNLRLLPAEILESVGLLNVKLINFNFLGLNLARTPSIHYLNTLWLIPLFAALTTFLSTKISAARTGGEQAENSAASTMKTMNTIFPLMTAWFAFSMPAGVGFYWILGNVIQIAQQLFLNHYFSLDAPEGSVAAVRGKPRVKKRKGKKERGR